MTDLDEAIRKLLSSATIQGGKIVFPTEEDDVFENALDSTVQDSFNEILEDFGTGATKSPVFEKFVEEITIRNISTAIVNPTGFLKGQLMRAIGPALVLLIAAQTAEQVIKILRSPGMFADPRFRRNIQNEVEFYLSRQQQQATRIGLRQVIIQSEGGFRNMNGAANTNTLRQIRENPARISAVGFNEITLEERSELVTRGNTRY